MMNENKSKHRDPSVVVKEVSLVYKSVTSCCLYTIPSTANLSFKQGEVLTDTGFFEVLERPSPQSQSSSAKFSFEYQLI